MWQSAPYRVRLTIIILCFALRTELVSYFAFMLEDFLPIYIDAIECCLSK